MESGNAPDLTLLVQIINFFILFGLLRWKLFRPLMNILEERQNKIKSDLDKAEQAKEEAIKIKKDYEDKLKESFKEAQSIVNEATQKGEKIKTELMEKGREEVLKMKQEGQNQINFEKEKAIGELRKDVSGLAVNIASRLIKKNIDEASNRDLINEFIGELKS
ncbi:MAG: F0F1 ATP synthase subunit B [Candidatus Eremiobacterota bacterium]